MDIAPFVQLVTQLLSEETNARQEAERALEEAKSNVPDQLVIALVLILQNESIANEYRSLAAVILRKQLVDPSTLQENTIETLKSNIIQALQHISDRIILRHLCFLTSAFAGQILSEGGNWPELLNFLVQWTQSQNEHYREAALEIFSQLLSHLDRDFEEFFETLKGLLITGLQDSSYKVRLAALSGTVHFLIYRARSRADFQPYLAHMFEIVTKSLSHGDDETARSALECLIELVEFNPSFFLQQLEELLEKMYDVARNHDIEDATRFSAVEFFVTLCESKPSVVRKHVAILTKYVHLMLQMMTCIEDNPDWNEGESADLDDEECDLGGESLDRTALAIRGNVLVPILFSVIPQLLNSDNWKHRRAALMAISIVGEGCIQVLTPNLDKVMQMIFPMFRDPHERVRWAACNSVGQLATDFGPLFQMRYHSDALQSLIMVMDDENNPRVQSHASAAIINFCDHCDPSIIEPFLPALLQKLDQLLKQGKMIVLEQSITAVAAVADCVKEKFIPFYDNFMQFFKNVLLNATGEAFTKLRGKSMEAISLVAVAVGLETFSKDAKEVLDALLAIQSGPHDEIQTPFLQQAWARLCKALGKEFVPYLSALVPSLLRSAQLPADLKVVKDTEAHLIDEDKWKRLTFNEDKFLALNMERVQEKSSALTMLFWLADELKEYFFPYVDKLIPICEESLRFYHSEQVRTASASLMPCILKSTTAYLANNPQTNINAQVQMLFRQVVTKILDAIESEPNIEVLITILSSLEMCFVIIGKNQLTTHEFTKLKTSFELLLNKFLQRREAFQQHLQEESEETYDISAINLHCDVFIKIGEVTSKCVEIFGSDILSYLTDICSVYKNFLVINKSESARVQEQYTAVYIFNNLVEFGGEAAQSIYQSWVGIIVPLINSNHPSLRKLAINGMSQLAQHAQNLFTQILANVINRLNAAIVSKNSREKYWLPATQSAIAAVGLIIEYYSSQIDLQQVLPIWLGYLPVTELTDATCIYQQLCGFFLRHTNIILGENFVYLPKILQIFASVIGTPLVTRDTSQTMISIVKQMQNDFPGELMQQAWVTLSPNQQENLRQVLA